MYFKVYLNFLILITYQIYTSDAQFGSCLYAICTCVDEVVSCRGKALISIPAQLIVEKKSQFKLISFSDNLITNLPSDEFQGLNLTRLWFRNNSMKAVSKNAFRGSKVSFLSFQLNDLEYLDTEVFEPLKDSLQTINLNSNRLTRLPDLSQMNELTQINATSNQISRLDSTNTGKTLFPDTLNLLALNNNMLTTLERKWFQNLENLEYLYLGGNAIEHIDDDAFEDLTSLVAIDLSNNTIKRISSEWFTGLNRIKYIFLSNQKATIAYFDNYAFDQEIKRVNATTIYFDGNQINSPSNRAFCSHQNPSVINNHYVFNGTLFKNVNPCLFRQLGVMKSPIEIKIFNDDPNNNEEIHNLNFNCSLVNYFIKQNIVLWYTHGTEANKTILNRNLCPRKPILSDICAEFVEFNCYNPEIFIVVPVESQKEPVVIQAEKSGSIRQFRFNQRESIKIPCTITAFRNEIAPDIEWRFKNSQMTSFDDDEVASRVNRSVLTRHLQIEKIERSAMGKYYCVRKDGNGPKIEIDILVQAVPSQPRITDAVVMERMSHIKWEIDDFGDLKPSEFYMEWFKNEEDIANHHTYSAKLHNNINDIKIPFKIPSNSSIRIYVANELGKSSKSEPFSVENKELNSPNELCLMELHAVFLKCFASKPLVLPQQVHLEEEFSQNP